VAILAPLAAEATLGVDVSSAVSSSTWSCIAGEGYSFAIVRVYRSSGSVDPNAAATIKAAHAGGIEYVDGYVFPCYSCGDPAGQIADTVNNLNSNGAVFGQLWLDIEGTQYWSTSCSSNVAFIQGLVDAAKSLGVTVGIYSSESQWTPIACGSTQFSNLQIWYAHYDGSASFSDWAPFGGWTTPGIKQYDGDVTLCSAGVDKNFY